MWSAALQVFTIFKIKTVIFFPEAGSLQVIPNTGLAGMSHTLALCTILLIYYLFIL